VTAIIDANHRREFLFIERPMMNPGPPVVQKARPMQRRDLPAST
jgi:hypothetical protein